MRTLACIAACLLAFPAFAANYLETDDVPPSFLYKPWAENSPEWRQEVQEIVALQKNARPQEIKDAASEVDATIEKVTAVLGPQYTRDRYPLLFSMLEKLDQDMKPIIAHAKEFWNTRRPYVAAQGQVKALIQPPLNAAYPSGHTYKGLVWAEVLGQLFPGEREKLRDRVERMAYHRVLSGMHYPVDIQGGRALARFTLGALWQHETFLRDFDVARKEIRQVKP